ncbi:hypothetical protein TanjilG_00457 [Lupinus angustifolius]|uniref:Uncharacterized protein n=1 Tax=Lupinus angustifolius TaxID=3871 RepID=A0A4P1QX40_LUPAN|nr:hypothetical protein TanjilG_00457 [Lupinus angustifolius]
MLLLPVGLNKSSSTFESLTESSLELSFTKSKSCTGNLRLKLDLNFQICVHDVRLKLERETFALNATAKDHVWAIKKRLRSNGGTDSSAKIPTPLIDGKEKITGAITVVNENLSSPIKSNYDLELMAKNKEFSILSATQSLGPALNDVSGAEFLHGNKGKATLMHSTPMHLHVKTPHTNLSTRFSRVDGVDFLEFGEIDERENGKESMEDMVASDKANEVCDNDRMLDPMDNLDEMVGLNSKRSRVAPVWMADYVSK